MHLYVAGADRVDAHEDPPPTATRRQCGRPCEASLGGGEVCPGMLCPHAAPGAPASRQCTDAVDRALADPVARREHRPSGVLLELRASGVVPGDRARFPSSGCAGPATPPEAAVLTDRPAG